MSVNPQAVISIALYCLLHLEKWNGVIATDCQSHACMRSATWMSYSMPMATNYSGWLNFFSLYYEHACGTLGHRCSCIPPIILTATMVASYTLKPSIVLHLMCMLEFCNFHPLTYMQMDRYTVGVLNMCCCNSVSKLTIQKVNFLILCQFSGVFGMLQRIVKGGRTRLTFSC